MTSEEKVAMLKEAGVWDVIGYPTCIDKLFDLVAAHERNRHAWTQEHWTQYEHAIAKNAAAAEREECAQLCEEISQDHWNLYKGRPPYTGSESGRADPHEQGVSMGASDCAAAIRARGQ